MYPGLATIIHHVQCTFLSIDMSMFLLFSFQFVFMVRQQLWSEEGSTNERKSLKTSALHTNETRVSKINSGCSECLTAVMSKKKNLLCEHQYRIFCPTMTKGSNEQF